MRLSVSAAKDFQGSIGIDPEKARIVWKSAPDGENAMGSNTSSPCVVKGRVYYGTTRGTFHILDAKDGRLIRTIPVAASIVASPTFANDSVYFQSVDAVVHCLDLGGDERWKWDHYQRYTEPIPERLRNYHPRSYDRPHFGGGEVVVSGKKVVSYAGWDQFCLEDRGDSAELLWCNRAALGKDEGVPAACSISGGYVYTAWPGVDGAGSLVRFSLEDGSFDKETDQLRDQWAILGTPAVRGATAYIGRHIRGVTAHEFGKGSLWSSFYWGRPEGFTPVFSSPALSRGHCVYTTVDGELVAVNLAARGSDLDRLDPAPFRFKTPTGKIIASSPAISNGRIYFGSDDGYLYILGPEGKLTARADAAPLYKRKSRVIPATGKAYGWPSPYGNPGNTNFVDDPELKPPFDLRWAVKSFGVFKQPLSATEEDIVYVTLAGTVVCLEQQTARIRWRRRLPRQRWARPGVLCAEGRVYVARPRQHVKPTPRLSALFCLDQETGKTLWQQEIVQGLKSRAVPVLADGRVAFGYVEGEPPAAVVEAWDARTGKPAWKLTLDASGKFEEPTGCSGEGIMYFSAGGGKGEKGETVAIEARTGNVLWRTSEAWCRGSGTPALQEGRLCLFGWEAPMSCISASNGKVIWQTERTHYWFHAPSLGSDYLTARGYSGRAERWRLADGKAEIREGKSIKLGGDEHACGPVALTSGGLSIAATVGGIYVRDVETGEMLWQSSGFAPRACSNAIVANGRIFYNPQVDGMLYCFEATKEAPE